MSAEYRTGCNQLISYPTISMHSLLSPFSFFVNFRELNNVGP